LDKLRNLQVIDLNGNQVEEVKGLEKLTNLKIINLQGNPIRSDEKDMIGTGLENAQEVVRYCQEKVKRQKSDS
jgi:Leucine-rich repeat (LRR) protein